MAWHLPVAGGYVTSNYGTRTSPGGVGSTTHRGVDVGGRGTDWLVRAVGSGSILATGSNSVRGLWVAVRHDDGTTTAYQHLADIRVRAGQRVAGGAVLGRMGTTGASTAAHLHLEAFPAGRFLRSGTAWASTGRTVDPEPYLRARGVDLRPGVVTVANPRPGTGTVPGSSLNIPGLTPIEEEDDMFTDDDRQRAAETLALLKEQQVRNAGKRADVTVPQAVAEAVWGHVAVPGGAYTQRASMIRLLGDIGTHARAAATAATGLAKAGPDVTALADAVVSALGTDLSVKLADELVARKGGAGSAHGEATGVPDA